MEPTPHDDRPRNPCSDDACLGEALDWIVHLNRLRVSETDVLALEGWCARSTAHARAWHEATALWALLLPAACELLQRRRRRDVAGRPRVAASVASGFRHTGRSAASGPASDTSSSPQLRPRHSWS